MFVVELEAFTIVKLFTAVNPFIAINLFIVVNSFPAIIIFNCLNSGFSHLARFDVDQMANLNFFGK